jgi:hypothetical protein
MARDMNKTEERLDASSLRSDTFGESGKVAELVFHRPTGLKVFL